MRIWLTAILLCALACKGGVSDAAPVSNPPAKAPPKALAKAARLELVARRLARPVGIWPAPGEAERLFIVEKVGRVRIFRRGKVEPTPFLDVSDRVSGWTEQGLLGLAFHPRFQENGKLYVNYTDKKGHTHVVEFRVSGSDPDRVDPRSEREVLFVRQPWKNHNGGHLTFGPDGKLWVGLGDGGAAFDPLNAGQSDETRLGKMLRIDVDQSPPKVETVQKGHRNPWRYAFDPKTGDLYIADVGQNQWEEVNVARANRLTGLNFGWRIMEASHCTRAQTCNQKGLVLPVVEYNHEVGCSITGGIVYRGKAFPELQGHYFYADYCTAIVRSFRLDGDEVTEHYDWRPILDPRKTLAEVASFGTDADGELYLVLLDGRIYKMVRR